MDNHLEDILFHQYIRIALAIVIIRKKPRGISAGAYIDEMLKEIEMQDRKMKVGECSKVMLKRQQDLMAVILSESGAEIGVNNSSSRHDKVESSRSTFNCENFALLSRHVPFQWVNREQPVLFVEEDSSILKRTLLGALDYLTMVTQCSKTAAATSLPVPKQLYLTCLHRLQAVSFTNDDFSKFKRKIEEMLDSLITCLLCGRKAFTYLEYEDIRDVVLAVGSCAGFWDVCVLRLSWHVHKFASSLRPVARGDDDLAGKVGGYDKICYLLLALEQMLVEASGQQMPCSETVDSIQSDLNGALLQISQAFPVFAHFLWRLQVLLLHAKR
ncbi:meiosis-specific protein MEI4-like [Acropora millepora]|uniref:meiosis-specific protein MEI4-like n=1 Tax=Acropora millepora TaxID=45264 RepID=UPI001CF44A55|nr:meiosis-specific protein MEI4-like [Acropora millepora]